MHSKKKVAFVSTRASQKLPKKIGYLVERSNYKYHKKGQVEKSEDESWLPKPEQVVVGLDERGSYDHVVLILELKGHFRYNDFKFGSEHKYYLQGQRNQFSEELNHIRVYRFLFSLFLIFFKTICHKRMKNFKFMLFLF